MLWKGNTRLLSFVVPVLSERFDSLSSFEYHPYSKTYIQTSLLREVLSRGEYHVLHFDLRIARFADLASLYLRLMEISTKIKGFKSEKSVKRGRTVFRESAPPHSSLRPSPLGGCRYHITLIAYSVLVYTLPEGSGIQESASLSRTFRISSIRPSTLGSCRCHIAFVALCILDCSRNDGSHYAGLI